MSDSHGHALRAGARVHSFEIQAILGIGGFGITYRAYDHTLNRIVAIKEYLPDGLTYRLPDRLTLTYNSKSDGENYEYGLSRFLDEARTLALFRDPSIVRVVGYIEANGTAYLIMDFEQGESLAQHLRRHGTLGEDEIHNIMTPILNGLRTVHARQYLHRDIKPSNILLRQQGMPVLLDFGSARQALGEQTMALTAMVTPGYAPFEQYHTKDRQGPWSDLYGLGATVYHCMTGFPPVAATERAAALYGGEPDPVDAVLATTRKRFSPELVDTIAWLLKPHAKDRPQSIDEVLAHLPDANLRPIAGAGGRAEAPRSVLPDTNPPISQEILDVVEVNLEQHIGPMAQALVHKAGRQTANIEDLVQLLARFIPSQQQQTEFLGRTQMIYNDRASSDEKSLVSEPAVVSERSIQQARQCLSAYLGPIAGTLVHEAAKRAANREEFFRNLAGELADEQQKIAFLRATKA